jgi:hypothetical protein
MPTQKKLEFDRNIADLKTASMAVLMQEVTRSMEQGTGRPLPNGKPIVEEQRVTK